MFFIKVSPPSNYAHFAHIHYFILVFLDYNNSHMDWPIYLYFVIFQLFGPKWVMWFVYYFRFLCLLFLRKGLLGGLEYTHPKLHTISRSEFCPDLTFSFFYPFLGPVWSSVGSPFWKFIKPIILAFFGLFLDSPISSNSYLGSHLSSD